MYGPLINLAAIVAGTLGGNFGRKFISVRLKERLPLLFGYISMSVGIMLLTRGESLPVITVSVLAGFIIGELLQCEMHLNQLANTIKVGFIKYVPIGSSRCSDEQFREQFTTLLVLFSASSTGLVGAMLEGASGDNSILIVKAVLDLATSATFATTLGLALVLTVIPQFFIQSTIFLLASRYGNALPESVLNDFYAVGGVLMLVAGLRLTKIQSFPIADLLPSLIVVLALSSYFHV